MPIREKGNHAWSPDRRVMSIQPAPDHRDEERNLKMRVLELEEEIARMERERLSSYLVNEEIAGNVESEALEALEMQLKDRQSFLQMMRDGHLLAPQDIPTEVLLDISEIVFWRHALAGAMGLQTLLYLRDEGEWQPAANHASQVPSLQDCKPDCVRYIDSVILDKSSISAGSLRCPSCGGDVWISPIELYHGDTRLVLGCLVGHALQQPLQPMQHMVDMIAGMAGRCASETYARQVAVYLEVQMASLIKRYTEQKQAAAESSRTAMLRQARISNDLAAARDELENALSMAQNATADAQRANRTKSMFLASMSHEIRTPLTCIIGFADLLTMPQLTEKEMHDFSVSVQQSGQVLLSIINNVLDLSKIEAGRLELEFLHYSIRSVLEEVRDIFRTSAVDKGLDLHVSVSETVPQLQKGDLTRLRQVVMNLVGNAVKFTSTGSVIITCRTCVEDPELLELKVVDTGPGISESGQARIFDAFSQAEVGTSRMYGGSGLGLAISQKIIHAMEGELRVESEIGTGTTFICRFRNELLEPAMADNLLPA
jgi:signal transduction histidine kinase